MKKNIILIGLGISIVALQFTSSTWFQKLKRGQTIIPHDYDIGAMTTDALGQIWACYNPGPFPDKYIDFVGILDDGQFTTSYEGIPGGYCNDDGAHIEVISNREFWFAGGGILRLIDIEKGVITDYPERTLSSVIDNSGNAWVASGSGFDVFDGKSWNHYDGANSPLEVEGPRYNFAIDRDNRAWLGTGNGIYIFDKERWQFLKGSPKNDRVDTIEFDNEGNAWVVHSNSSEDWLSKYDGKNWVAYPSQVSLGYRSIFFDHQGRPWVPAGAYFDHGRFAILDGGDFKYYFVDSHNYDVNISIDRDGRVWIDDTDRFIVLSPEELILLAEPTARLFMGLSAGGVWLIEIMLVILGLTYAFNLWKGVGLSLGVGVIFLLFDIAAYDIGKALDLDGAFVFGSNIFSGPFIMFGGLVGGTLGRLSSRHGGKPYTESRFAVIGMLVGFVMSLCVGLLWDMLDG